MEEVLGLRKRERTIKLWQGSYLWWTVRREVCHAVDYQNDVVRGREEVFDYPAVPDIAAGYAPNEAFAEICGMGRSALAVMWPNSCGDDGDMRPVDIVRHEVWGLSDEAPEPAPVVFERVAALQYNNVFPERPSVDEILGTQLLAMAEDRLRVSVTGSGQSVVHQVDPWTGVRLPTIVGTYLPPPEPPAVPPNWNDGSSQPGGGVLADGTGIVTVAHRFPNDARIQRTLAIDRGPLSERHHRVVHHRWRVLDGPVRR